MGSCMWNWGRQLSWVTVWFTARILCFLQYWVTFGIAYLYNHGCITLIDSHYKYAKRAMHKTRGRIKISLPILISSHAIMQAWVRCGIITRSMHATQRCIQAWTTIQNQSCILHRWDFLLCLCVTEYAWDGMRNGIGEDNPILTGLVKCHLHNGGYV